MTATTALTIGCLLLAVALLWVMSVLSATSHAVSDLISCFGRLLSQMKALVEVYDRTVAKVNALEAEIGQLKAAQSAERIA